MCSYDVSHLLQRKARLIFKFSSVFCTSGCTGLSLAMLQVKARCFLQGVVQCWSRYQEGCRMPTVKAFSTCSAVGNNSPARGKWDQAIFYLFQKTHQCFYGPLGHFPGVSSVVFWGSAVPKQLQADVQPQGHWRAHLACGCVKCRRLKSCCSCKGVCVTHCDSGTKA